MTWCELEVGARAEALVLRPIGELDLDAVEAVRATVAAAREAGTSAALALDGVTRFPGRALGALSQLEIEVVPGDADHPRPFLLPTSAGWWLVDAAERRLCRLDRPTHPLFVPEAAWRAYERLDIRAGWIVATTPEGERIVSGLGSL